MAFNSWCKDDILTDERYILIEGWARDGLSEKDIAKNLDITQQTLIRWKKDDVKLVNALKKGRDVSNRILENALFKRAIGYDYVEKKIETNAKGVVKITEMQKHIPADTGALAFALKNRMPDVWKDRYVNEVVEKELQLAEGVLAKIKTLSEDDD